MDVASVHSASPIHTGRSVLVVHDHEPQRLAVARTLQARGFRARTVSTSREALESARQERLDVILMDMDAPGLDGWESARRLKADPVTRHILVIALSERAEVDVRNQAMRVGCDAFETKPLDLDHLVESVRALLPA